VLTLIGSKEGIGHLPLAFVNPGDIVLIPDPAYPVYLGGTLFAGGTPYRIPLLRANDFLPDLWKIPQSVLSSAKILYLNYPNNPTCAVASLDFFNQVVEFAYKANIIVCHDAAYTEVVFDGYKPPSFLQADGAKEVGVEFHSLSKTYNMTGWRIGFVVGNKEILQKLKKVKSNLDSGVFQAIQYAGIAALSGSQACVEEMRKIYKERRDILVDGLRKLGWEILKPKATFYLWIQVPKGYTSTLFASKLLKMAGIITTPGVGFGEYGEGYIRVALTVGREKLKEVVERMSKIELKNI
jgi:LL-diaminopimelate aminotransferase